MGVEIDTLLTMKGLFTTVRAFCAGVAILVVAGVSGTAFGQTKTMLYVPDNALNNMPVFTMTAGSLVAGPTQSANNQPLDVAVTTNNKFIYLADAGGFVDAFSVDALGNLTPIGSVLAGSAFSG